MTGRIEPGWRADFLVLDADHPNLAGRAGDALLDSLVFVSTPGPSPIAETWVGGRRLPSAGRHPQVGRDGPGPMRRSSAASLRSNKAPMNAPANVRIIRSPRGPELTAKTWGAEAAMRMLMNNLDPEVAERPEDLVVYGGIGKAARDWQAFDRIVAELKNLEPDETLLVQSGKPVGVFRTHADAPRVLIANSNLVPKWATWEHFNELDRKGLMMYGQMTAGSWIYIGTQGIVQGTYETFVEVGRQHYGGDLAGRWILTAGLGGMGGAQPLAATMAGASCLAIECQRSRIEKRLETRYLDTSTETSTRRCALIDESVRSKTPLSVGLLGNAAEIVPELVRRGVRPDVVTDQTSAHDLVNGYLPKGWTVAEWEAKRQSAPEEVEAAARGLDQGARGRPCWPIWNAGRARPSTTATTSARSPRTRGWSTPSTSRASCRPISARCSAAASARSAGPRSPATRRTSTRPTRR